MMKERLPYDTEPVSEGGLDLVSVFVAILSEWKIGLIAFVVAAAVGLAYVRSLKPQYVATATFLPSSGGGSVQAETLASLFSPGGGSGSLYIGLLRSRGVQDDVVDRVHLRELYGTQSHELARLILNGKSFFSQGADSIATISIRDENAQIAAQLADAYLLALQDLSDKMGQSQAAESRKLFSRQLEEQRGELQDAELRLVRLQERTGEVAAGSQAAAGVGNIIGYQSQISGLQVQLAVAKQSEAEGNPDVQRIRSQIAQLEAEERQQATGKGVTGVGAPTTAVRIPAINLELSHAEQDVADKRALVNSLAGQFSSARSQADLTHPAFQVIDRAVVPEFRVWPPRAQYDAAALIFGAFVAFFAIMIRLVARRILSNPTHRVSLGRLRGAF